MCVCAWFGRFDDLCPRLRTYTSPTHTHIIKIPNQLGHAKHAQGPTTFAEMRKLAASYLRSHPDDFLPFMDLPDGETDAEGR